VAGYKKKRARELRHDRFRDTTLGVFDRLGDKLEGRGKTILYGIAALIAVIALAGIYSWWSGRKNDEARRALGRAIEIASAPVAASPAPGSTDLSFPTEKDRAERAVKEFQAVADKYGKPYHEKALYFHAANLMTVDRAKGISEMESLAQSSDNEVATLSKFALAQAREADAQYDQAASLYAELAKQNGLIVTQDVANLRLAAVYEKQGKKKEAADLLYTIAEKARTAKDPEGKPITPSPAAREALDKLEKLDPARYAQLPPEPPPTTNLPF
jgi:predicted negative regulator of RcsB-dependent stress response